MAVLLQFNATQVKPSTGSRDILEDGEYIVSIFESTEKAVKGKSEGEVTGKSYLEFGFRVMQGSSQGKEISTNLNIKHDNPDTVKWAYAELSAICHVTGQLNIQTTAQLHGIPFKIKVSKEERTDKPGSFNNRIKAYYDINGNLPGEQNKAVAGAAGQVQQAQQPQPAQAIQQPQAVQQVQQPAAVQPNPGFVDPASIVAQPQPAQAQQPQQAAVQPSQASQALDAATPSWAQ